MVIFRSIFSIFLPFNTQLTHLNASNLLNFDSLNRFSPIASQSWCSGVSKMATYIYQGTGKRPRQCCPKEVPKDQGESHSRARRAREWLRPAIPRARRARGRAKLSRRLPVLLYVFHDSAKNRDFHGTI